MNILFLTNDARDEAGGAFFSQKAFVEELAREGHRAILMATKRRGGEKPQSFEVQFLATKYGDFGRVWQLIRFVKQNKIDIVIASMKPQILLLSLASIFLDRKKTLFFATCRMGDHFLRFGKHIKHIPMRLFFKFIIQRLDGVMAISKFASLDVQKTYYLKEPPFVIYNPFDTETICKKADEHAVDFAKKTIVNVGRLVPQKAQHLLAEMARELLKTRDDFEVVIVGQDGSNRAKIESLIAKYNLADHVKLAGFHSNPFPYIKNASVFVLTSIHEGFGRVVAESMALGVPVVAFRSEGGGHIELLEENRGFLVDDGDIEALAKAVSAVLDSDTSKTVANAKRFVETLTPQSRVQNLLEFIARKQNAL